MSADELKAALRHYTNFAYLLACKEDDARIA
jgi:hypothetical protein